MRDYMILYKKRCGGGAWTVWAEVHGLAFAKEQARELKADERRHGRSVRVKVVPLSKWKGV